MEIVVHGFDSGVRCVNWQQVDKFQNINGRLCRDLCGLFGR